MTTNVLCILCFAPCAKSLNGLRAFDFPRTKAAGADVNSFTAAGNDRFYAANVGLPGSVGFAVGVGHVVTEGDAFTAYTAFCHFLYLL